MKQAAAVPRRRARLPAFLLRADLRMVAALFSLLLICGTWLGTYQELKASRASNMADARRDARSLARLFLEHAYRTIEAADRAVLYLRYRYVTQGAALDLAAQVDNGLVARNVFHLFSIVDAHGDMVLSSQPFQAMNLADREHIRAHTVGNSDELYISKPVFGRVSKRWSLQLTRRINRPDGSYGGVIVVSMDPHYFTRLYHEIDVGQYGAIALVGQDGIVRVRRTGANDAMGEDVSGGNIMQAMRERGLGMIEANSPLDKRRRIYAFQRLPEYPLYSLVGIDLEERLAPYYKERRRMIGLAALITTGIVAFNLFMLWQATVLLRTRREALAASQAKSRFLSNMSHELRTPLNGVLGYAEALRDMPDPALQRQFADQIHQSGMRLLRMIDAILELSALEDRHAQLSMRQENLRALIGQTMIHHHPTAEAKGLQFTCHVAGDVPQLVRCDGAKVMHVIDNLLGNAIRFTEQGRIAVRVQLRDDQWLDILVEDSGIGIAPQQRERIFEKFTQADDHPSRRAEGAGLGLTVARQLAALMGGELLLRSTTEHGSTFVFTLPL